MNKKNQVNGDDKKTLIIVEREILTGNWAIKEAAGNEERESRYDVEGRSYRSNKIDLSKNLRTKLTLIIVFVFAGKLSPNLAKFSF